jgi:hypothetical protein
MQNTISSLAILAVRLDTEKDYIETFVPFIVHLFKIKNYETVDPYTVSTDFRKEYGLIIPPLAMLTILTRTKHRGYIKEERKNYYPVKSKVIEDDFSFTASNQEKKFEKVIKGFVDFAKTQYNFEINEDQADGVFIAFLRHNDIQLLFAQQNGTTLPETQVTHSEEFILNKYIIYSSKNEPETFQFVCDIAIGHIIASTILYNDFNEFRAFPNVIDHYLDIGLLFYLLGINGQERELAYKELINNLRRQNCNLRVFKHTVDELEDILENCREKIISNIYDGKLANRTLRFFRENNFSAAQVEIFINGVEGKLSSFGIEVVKMPEYDLNGRYQIDEEKLADIIIETYRDKDPDFNSEDKKYTISLDVDSISAVYRLRQGIKPKKLKDAVCAFITSNTALACANKRFELSEFNPPPVIPIVLTDVFICTFIWLNSPMQDLQSYNEKRIIAQSYAAVQPTPALFNKLLDSATELENDNKITHDQFILLRESSVVRTLLADSTLGEIGRFVDKTALDILDELEIDAKKQVLETKKQMEELLLIEKKEKQKIESSLQTEIMKIENDIKLEEIKNLSIQKELVSEKSRIKSFFDTISKILTFIVLVISSFIVVSVLFICLSSLLNPNGIKISSGVLIFSLIVSTIFNILSFIFGWSIIGMKPLLQLKIFDFLMRLYYKKP